MTSSIRNNFEDPDFAEQLAKELAPVVERRRLIDKNAGFMREMWQRSIKAVGEHQAKEIMRQIMGEKEPGPSKTDEDNALEDFICGYISHCGPKQGDGKIAKRLLESKPYYVQWGPGAIVVTSDEFQAEINSVLALYPAVKHTPIKKGLAALKKQVERVRQRAIDDGVLPKEYAPRRYYRGQ
jgi:hypothetical protein